MQMREGGREFTELESHSCYVTELRFRVRSDSEISLVVFMILTVDISSAVRMKRLLYVSGL